MRTAFGRVSDAASACPRTVAYAKLRQFVRAYFRSLECSWMRLVRLLLVPVFTCPGVRFWFSHAQQLGVATARITVDDLFADARRA